MELAVELGMGIMIHVADPDTVPTKYADASVYGTKLEQYEPLEAVLRDYEVPFMVAHMGGWPETSTSSADCWRASLLHLDASATKWIVREVRAEPARSWIPRPMARRILFGSDIVALDSISNPKARPPTARWIARPAASPSVRSVRQSLLGVATLWETGYDGESPIADPDLALVDPEHMELDAPRLRVDVPEATLVDFYRDAARERREAAARLITDIEQPGLRRGGPPRRGPLRLRSVSAAKRIIALTTAFDPPAAPRASTPSCTSRRTAGPSVTMAGTPAASQRRRPRREPIPLGREAGAQDGMEFDVATRRSVDPGVDARRGFGPTPRETPSIQRAPAPSGSLGEMTSSTS